MVQKDSLKKIIIITGPTASGKSDFSLQCAHEFNGEVIGCDSMQIYKGMDIGTGKLTMEEREGIPHFMIDIVPPDVAFSVSNYVEMCENIISDICARGKLPILTGGTGFYIRALLNGLNFAGTPKSDELRMQYETMLRQYGKEHLYAELKKVDLQSCEKISINDTKRIIRALEIYALTGVPKSMAVGKSDAIRYDYRLLVLSPSRERLYERINRRVDKMMQQGLIEEVKTLYVYRQCQSMQAIGYKELIAYLEQRIPLAEAVETIKKNSRHYAKRQLTYFKHMDLQAEFVDDYEESMNSAILNTLKEFA